MVFYIPGGAGFQPSRVPHSDLCISYRSFQKLVNFSSFLFTWFPKQPPVFLYDAALHGTFVKLPGFGRHTDLRRYPGKFSVDLVEMTGCCPLVLLMMLMAGIMHQLRGSLSHDLPGFTRVLREIHGNFRDASDTLPESN